MVGVQKTGTSSSTVTRMGGLMLFVCVSRALATVQSSAQKWNWNRMCPIEVGQAISLLKCFIPYNRVAVKLLNMFLNVDEAGILPGACGIFTIVVINIAVFAVRFF